MLIRLHPIHMNEQYITTDFDRYINDRYASLEAEFDNVKAYRSARATKGSRMDMDLKEFRTIRDQIRMSDVVVTMFSTIMLESFCLGTPVVNIGFDVPDPASPREFRSISVDMDQIHLRRIVKTGPSWNVMRAEDLAPALRQALEDTGAKAQQVAEAIASECGRVDGRSGRRMAQAVARLAGLEEVSAG